MIQILHSPLQSSLFMYVAKKSFVIYLSNIASCCAQLRDAVVCSAFETCLALQCDLVDLLEGVWRMLLVKNHL